MRARNVLASTFLSREDCTHLAFVDADMRLSPKDPFSRVRALTLGLGQYLLGDLDAAGASFKRAQHGHFIASVAYIFSAFVLARQDRLDEAHEDLTPRELDILKEIAAGKSNKSIAFDLGLTEGTVKGYVSTVLSKLGVTDRTQAALYAVKNGLFR